METRLHLKRKTGPENKIVRTIATLGTMGMETTTKDTAAESSTTADPILDRKFRKPSPSSKNTDDHVLLATIINK